MALVLTLISGIAWTVVYIEAIRLGFRDRTYAIPVAALGLNFAWESIYAIHEISLGITAQSVINVAWALADAVIVYTFFRFGRDELPKFVTPAMFVSWGILIFVASYAVQLLFILQFGYEWAQGYSAFLQNALMSGLFIAMFAARGGMRGQSLTIAVAKWLGTLAPTIQYGVIDGTPLILGLGIICCVFDVIYIWLLMRAKAEPSWVAKAAA